MKKNRKIVLVTELEMEDVINTEDLLADISIHTKNGKSFMWKGNLDIHSMPAQQEIDPEDIGSIRELQVLNYNQAIHDVEFGVAND